MEKNITLKLFGACVGAIFMAIPAVRPAHAGWELDSSFYGHTNAGSVHAQILPTDTRYNPSDYPAGSVGDDVTTVLRYKWNPQNAEPTVPPTTSVTVNTHIQFSFVLSPSVTPNPTNPGPVNATAKCTFGLYNPNVPTQNPTELWVYQKGQYYDYRTRQIGNWESPSPMPTSQILSQQCDVSPKTDVLGGVTYFAEAQFKFTLLNEAAVTTSSVGMNGAGGWNQGGSGEATSGENKADGDAAILTTNP